MLESLTIKLDIAEGQYEGPLDLLLHLIDKNKIDINDIPMSTITSQYLEYLDLLESLSLDVAGDFLVMAATLTNIKSRLLLPRLEDDEPVEDPRLELTRPLLEYSTLRDAAKLLDERPVLDRDVFTRGELETTEAISFDDHIQATLFELIEAWRELATRHDKEEKTGLKFLVETKTIGQKLAEIRSFLLEVKSAHFQELAKRSQNTLELALSFLAILELARVGFLRLYQQTETDFSGPRLWLADPGAQDLDPGELDYR
ncbi:MAG: segregation/condensation protein A [Deltaproteobacteria bacterium]|jgi:segregation and condensation protein A|nr:segregation/condensation protein A [Deltaproteobacteria bacterium]